MKKILMMLLMILITAQTTLAAEQVFFYHTDPAGTPLAMTNTSGTVVWKADYKPFGEEQTVAATMPNDKRFVGKEKDAETGLSYFGGRYEDARTGRFISPDSVRAVDEKTNKTNEKMLLNPQRLNTYAYALNNPYRYTDPDGHNPILIAAGLILLGEMFMPQTMGSSLRDSFINQHWGDLLMLPLGIEREGAAAISSLARQSGNELAELGGMLRNAVRGKGNFGIGSASREQAEAMGKAWVGEGYSASRDGKALVSTDGLRVYRPATYKSDLGKTQANFEQKTPGISRSTSNAHLDIKE